MILIISLFGLAILLGLSLVFMGLRYHRSSLALGLIHAGVALAAVVLLIVHIFQAAGTHMLYNDAALLFILTLLGGLVLLMTHNNQKSAPIAIVIVHAALAFLAVTLLINGYLQA